MSDFLDRISGLSPKRLALLAAELQERLDAAESRRAEPIAIVGLACRFPGADGPDELWRLLRDGVDAIREVPPDRWDVDGLYDPDPDALGKIATRFGGFLPRVDLFDAALYGISPREAASMDPQQRLMLEVAWEALENAGLAPDRLQGSATGVFVGICNADYYQVLGRGGLESFDLYRASGNANSVVSGRISYVLGLQGPAVSVDTACSSSLVATHLACQSLWSGEVQMALAGGVNVICSPETTVALSRSRMMAPDGRCKAFDSRADGFVRGEGCGVLVLKRLADARAGHDRVLAVIRGSALNQDGRSSGLTAPNGPSQEAVIRAALARAGVEPAEVGYVEAHGTGTPLGDPIEARALGAVLRAGRDPSSPALVGSIKTNLGHLESAAGVAGLIKVVLALQHGEIPPSLHLRELNPHVDWASLPLRVPTERVPWPRSERRRVAGVSSFGFSGTNGHVVLEEAPAPESQPATLPDRTPHALVLSAKTEASLLSAMTRLADHLEARPDQALADVVFTLGVGRAQLQQRAAVLASDAREAGERLRALAAGGEGPCLVRGHARPGAPPRVAFLFPGQGPQYAGMGRQLYQGEPAFRQALDECQELLREQLDRPLLSILHPEPTDAGLVDRTLYTQPAIFAIEWALSQMWRSWGVVPSAVAGHSVGEYAAACVAGVLALPDALALIAERGRLAEALAPGGEMVSLLAGEEDARAWIAPYEGRVSLAAINGPSAVVISGEAAALREIVATLEPRGVKCKPLVVTQAGHSPLVEPMLAGLRRAGDEIAYAPAKIDLVSTLTGQLLGAGKMNGEYWAREAREPVRFWAAMLELRRLGYEAFVEIGPHPVLLGMARDCLGGDYGVFVPSLRRGRSDRESMVEGLAMAWSRGVTVDWSLVGPDTSRSRIALPTYPFQRERCWAPAPPPARMPSIPTHHPLLGGRLRSAWPTFEERLDPARSSLLSGHRVFGVPLAAAAVLAEMALAAGERSLEPGLLELRDLDLREPLAFDGPRTVQVTLAPASRGSEATVAIHSRGDDADGGFTHHAEGRLGPRTEGRAEPIEPVATVRDRCRAVPAESFFAALGGRGIELQPPFRGLAELWRGEREALGLVRAADEHAMDKAFHFHPAMLDACLQVLGAAVPGDWSAAGNETHLLAGWERLWLNRPAGRAVWSHARVQPAPGGRGYQGQVTILDEAGCVLGRVDGAALKRTSRSGLVHAVSRDQAWFHELQWAERPLAGQRLPAPDASDLPGPAAVAASVAPLLAAKSLEHGLEEYDDAVRGLDRLATGHVVDALRSLGWKPATRERVTAGSLAQRLGIVPAQRRLFGRLLAMLAEDGVLRAAGSELEVVTGLADPEPAGDERRGNGRGDCAAEAALLARCGPFLADVLAGRRDPLQLLFPGGSFEATEPLYETSPYARSFNAALGEAVAMLVAALPKGRSLRLLEIGAGTGGSTTAILPRLPADRASYIFTDLSRLFLSRAEDKLRQHAFVRYALLDAEKPYAAQGVPLASCDVVLASNVLHATRDLAQTLTHAREALAPGGLLLLLEGTRPHRWVDVTFGLTEGWWRFEDTALRPAHPLLAPDRWRQVLHRAGFEEATALPADESCEMALLLARAPLAASTATGLPEPRRTAIAERSFVVLADPSEALGAAVCEEVRRAGGAASLVARAEEIGDAVATARSAAGDRPLVVVHVPRGTVLGDETLPSVAVDEQSRQLLDLVRAARAAAADTHASLWVATRGAVAQASGDVDLSQASLWGLGRVIALEKPDAWGGLVDLEPHADDGAAAALVDEIGGSDGEDQVSLRGGIRRVARLRSVPAPRSPRFEIRSDGSYLITGGLGGLGLGLARWLAENGARHVVLTSRRGLVVAEPPEARDVERDQALHEIESLGAQLEVVRADVASEIEMRGLLERLDASGHALRGVFHLAADIRPASLAEMDEEAIGTMLKPKLGGALVLHRLTQERALDAFVLFSSTTAILGVAGLGHYAAANQFLDALAHRRRSLGLPALSVNWGTWEVMRRASAEEQRQFAAGGLLPLPLDPAFDAMARLCAAGVPQSFVAAVDWDVLRTVYESRRRRPLLEELGGQAAHAASRTEPAAAPDLPKRFAQAPPARRHQVVLDHVKDAVARILGHDARAIDPGQGLFEMGMDSLMSVELKGRLEKAVGRSLPSTLTFNYPTAAALADYLVREVLESPASPPAPTRTAPAAAPASTPAEDDDLTEEELAERLAARLREATNR